jgi:hypothetical protein
MSCERNSNRVGRLAGAGAGISATACKFSHTVGAMVGGARQAAIRAGQTFAPLSDAALDFVDRQGFGASLMRSKAFKGAAVGAAVSAMLAADQRYRAGSPSRKPGKGDPDAWMAAMGLGARSPSSTVARAALVVELVGRSSTRVGELVAHAGRREQVGAAGRKIAYSKMFGLRIGETSQKVKLFSSSLTGPLNKLDWIGMPKAKIKSGDGVTFETNGRTWHRGTSTADTPAGERTITHLQSLSLPAAHFYFNRPVTDEQAVGMANEKMRPETIPGYVGTVTRFESLAPGWGGVKHAMIKNALFYGRSSSRDGGPSATGAPAATDSSPKARNPNWTGPVTRPVRE